VCTHTAVLQLYPDTVVDLPGYSHGYSRLYSYLHVVYTKKYGRSIPMLYVLNLVYGYMHKLQGRHARRGYLVTRITVTLSVFNFSTRFFAQIVENRETQLSSHFLSPGDNFSKSYDENRFRKFVSALNRARGI
jgi:hypothetical protein